MKAKALFFKEQKTLAGMKKAILTLLILGIVFLVIFSAPRETTTASVNQKDVTGAEALPLIALFFIGLAAFSFGVGKYYPSTGKRR